MTSLFAHGIFKSFLRLFHHACGFLFNFSKVTENVNNDKTIDFFHIFSDIAIGSENSPSLN